MADRLTAAQVIQMTGLTLARLELMHDRDGPLRCGSDGMYLRREVEQYAERRRR